MFIIEFIALIFCIIIFDWAPELIPARSPIGLFAIRSLSQYAMVESLILVVDFGMPYHSSVHRGIAIR